MATRKHPTFKYPTEQDRRCGCKVSWLYYKSKRDANAAAKVAVREGRYRAGLGYDYGYCCPGHIVTHPDWKGMGPMYEVCIP